MRDAFIHRGRHLTLLLAALLLLPIDNAHADTGMCNGTSIDLPFTDVQGNPFFCNIAAAFFSGLTNGTTATTYTPATDVTREQMAAFISRTQEQALRRSSRRAALKQWWTPSDIPSTALTGVGSQSNPRGAECDGADVWVAREASDGVARIPASSGGGNIQSWTGVTNAYRWSWRAAKSL